MKLFNNKKCGFSLAEVLICVTIAGVIATVGFSTVKPQQKATKYLYLNAYKSLARAFYNGQMNGFDPFVDDANAEHSDEKDTGTETLCKALTSYINSTDNELDGTKDYSKSCSATKLTSELANSFTDSNVQFIASGSGMKFYLTKKLNAGTDVPFYIIFVDINGDKKPNVYTHPANVDEKVKKQTPDIYAFAAIKSGRILPIGSPEYDTKLLTAKLVYFGASGDPIYSENSRAYYQAKGEAWGYYSAIEDPITTYDEQEPFTMNDYIRSKINTESNIVKNFPNLKEKEPKTLSNVGKCSSDDLESCFIYIEEYRY